MHEPAGIRRRFHTRCRLSRTDEFSSVLAFRRSLRGTYFQLSYRPNGLERARIGFIVAKKLAHHAVVRNLVKRVAREVFRCAQAALPAYDLVLRLLRPVAPAERQALRADIEGLLKRLPR